VKNKVSCLTRSSVAVTQDEQTGLTKGTPVRIEITFYYPAPLVLSEDVLLLDEDFHFVEKLDEPTIQIDPTSSAASIRAVEPQTSQQSPTVAVHPSPSTADQGLLPVATTSAASVASSARSRKTGKRQVAKKARAEGAAGGGSAGSGGEEQVFNHVVERFDDDVVLDSMPASPPGAVDPSPTDDRRRSPATKAGKKKARQQAVPPATEKPTDDVGLKTPISEAQQRHAALERLWNVERSPDARCTVDSLTG